jgi:hypothetical protein
VFDERTWVLIPDFSVSMNDCGTGQTRIKWRALQGKVQPGIADFKDSFDHTPVKPTVTGPPAAQGTMIFGNCEQPTFRGATGSRDIAVDASFFDPAAG